MFGRSFSGIRSVGELILESDRYRFLALLVALVLKVSSVDSLIDV